MTNDEARTELLRSIIDGDWSIATTEMRSDIATELKPESRNLAPKESGGKWDVD